MAKERRKEKRYFPGFKRMSMTKEAVSVERMNFRGSRRNG
jgi:hypothetical protein